MAKKRLDELLIEREIFPTKDKAKRHILAGEVLVDGVVVDKVGEKVPTDADLTVNRPSPYVSRGAEKLLGFIEDFPDLEIEGKICLDVGSSTGGFTQVLLERDAELVYAVDVGKGLLDLSLRNDPGVVLMEEVNARYLKPSQFPRKPQLAVIDVSFISLELVIPPVKDVLRDDGQILCLIKPQFETKPKYLRRGILKDEGELRNVLKNIVSFACDIGLTPEILLPSQIKGAKGNQEYFLLLGWGGEKLDKGEIDVMIEGAIEKGGI